MNMNLGKNRNKIVGNPQGHVATLVIGNNGTWQNANQIRCYNCMGIGHYVRNYTNKTKVRDSTYYTRWLMLVQQEEPGISLTARHHDFLLDASDEEREEVELTSNYLFVTKLQPASSNMNTASVYDCD
nr:hypothetical protein [Tanacetum cinerariifolium]